MVHFRAAKIGSMIEIVSRWRTDHVAETKAARTRNSSISDDKGHGDGRTAEETIDSNPFMSPITMTSSFPIQQFVYNCKVVVE